MPQPESDKNGPSASSQPKEGGIAPDVREILRQAQARLDLGRNQTSHKMRIAVDKSAEIITDPALAERLSRRHNSRLRTSSIADAMYRAYYGSAEEKRDAFETLSLERASADEDGVFLYEYPEQMMVERLISRYEDGSPEYVIAEASGSHPRPGHARYGKKSPGADAQIHLPEPRYGAKPVFSFPREGDPGAHTIAMQQLIERPHVVAQIDDLVSDTDMGQVGLASSALDAALRKVAEMNADRGEFAIEAVTAEIVMITGFRRHDGIVHMFGEEIRGTPIHNQRSMVVFNKFANNVVHSFRDVATLVNRHVPVTGHAYVESLIVDWYVKVAHFKKD